MKILYSAYSCDPNKGSEPGFGWNWAYHSALSGHSVWCLTNEKNRSPIEKKVAEMNLPNLCFIFVRVPKWVDYIYKFQPGLYINYLFWQHKAFKKAKKLDEYIDFDVVHHTTWGSLQLGTSLWKLNKPLIFGPVGGGQIANPKFKKYFLNYWKQEIARKYISKLLLTFNPYVRKTLQNAKLVLVTNIPTLKMAKENGAKNTKLFLDTSLPENFYQNHENGSKKDNTLKILWVGRLFARKGLLLVLEALAKVHPSVNFKITILGDGPLGEHLPRWGNRLNLNEKINWEGQVTWERVKMAYREHDVFMFCSLRDSFASQFLEAMSNRLPIITLNTNGASTFVPDNASIKIEESTPEKTLIDLANAVEYLYKNPSKLKKMGENAYKHSTKHKWSDKTNTINNYYKKYSGNCKGINIKKVVNI